MTKDYSPASTPPNEQRRLKYAMSDEWTRAFLQRAQIGHVATRWDEQPFITPVNFWYDPERHCIYFHSSTVGRLHANAGRCPEVCFEASEWGRLLPANTALNFSIQYESAIAFGKIQMVTDEAEQHRVLYALIEKSFPGMQPGVHYRPITAEELGRTIVYAIPIESWSGKRNWKEQAAQSDDWPPLGPEWLENI